MEVGGERASRELEQRAHRATLPMGTGGTSTPRTYSPDRLRPYAEGVESRDIGHGVSIVLDDDNGGLIWKHTGCRCWFTLRFKPDSASTGHELVKLEPLTIRGSLLCPKGCGSHGHIVDGRWVPC